MFKILMISHKKVLPILLATSTLAIALVMTGCGDNNSNREQEIANAVDSMNLFLSQAKDVQNFTAVTDQPNV